MPQVTSRGERLMAACQVSGTAIALTGQPLAVNGCRLILAQLKKLALSGSLSDKTAAKPEQTSSKFGLETQLHGGTQLTNDQQRDTSNVTQAGTITSLAQLLVSLLPSLASVLARLFLLKADMLLSDEPQAQMICASMYPNFKSAHSSLQLQSLKARAAQ